MDLVRIDKTQKHMRNEIGYHKPILEASHVRDWHWLLAN